MDTTHSSTSGVEDARLEGFADCEELVAAMLERMADAGENIQGWKPEARDLRARTLREAALAVRLGQHRSAE